MINPLLRPATLKALRFLRPLPFRIIRAIRATRVFCRLDYPFLRHYVTKLKSQNIIMIKLRSLFQSVCMATKPPIYILEIST